MDTDSPEADLARNARESGQRADLALTYIDGAMLAKWYRFLDRFPKSCAWNAYRLEGQVFSRVDGWDGDIDLIGFSDRFDAFERRGLLIQDMTPEEETPLGGRATYLKMRTTDAGRAALVVWMTRYPVESREE